MTLEGVLLLLGVVAIGELALILVVRWVERRERREGRNG